MIKAMEKTRRLVLRRWRHPLTRDVRDYLRRKRQVPVRGL